MFFSGEVAVRGRCWRVSVSAVARLDPESGRQNVHETVARARFHIIILIIVFIFPNEVDNEVEKVCHLSTTSSSSS